MKLKFEVRENQFNINKEESWNEIYKNCENSSDTKTHSLLNKNLYRIAIAACLALVAISIVFQNIYPDLLSTNFAEEQAISQHNM